MKIIYSDKKSGKSTQVEVSPENQPLLIGKKINDVIDGDLVGLSGYRLRITGGSDKSGFPMYKYVQGSIKTSVLMDSTKKKVKAVRRKTVVGGMVSNDTALINTLIVEYGSRPVNEIFASKEENKDK